MRVFLVFCFTFVMNGLVAQTPFYQDIFKGGGYSKTIGISKNGVISTSSFDVTLPQSSYVKKVFLFLAADGNDSITVSIDDNTFFMDTLSKVTVDFNSFSYSNYSFPFSSIYCKDITSEFNINLSTHVLKVPNYDVTRYKRFSSPTVVFIYKNDNYPIISTSLVLNNQDVDSLNTYNIERINPISNGYPVSFSVISSYICDTINDGTYVSVNNNSIGLIGGTDANTVYSCSGVYGCFTHYNNTSFGIDDDISDSLMNGTDALADIKHYVDNQADSLSISFLYKLTSHPLSSAYTNPIRYLFFAHSTKCDTLHSRVNISDTTICAGEPLALQVGGDSTYTYAWRYRGEVISTDTSLNIAPQHNQLYSILVSDTNGCSKTEIINIKVNPTPQSYYSMIDAVCPQENGVIVIDSVQGQAPPYVYRKANGSWQTAPVYANLAQGEYIIQTQDTNQCIATDTLAINSINNTLANFTVPTNTPYIPTTIDFYNTSEHATEYLWYINNSLVTNTTDLSYYFSQSGSYTISLVASQNNQQCSDTLLTTIELSEEQYLYIPPLWQVGSALQSYSYGYKALTLHLLNNLGQVISVEQYELNNGTTELFNHRQLSRGVYYFHLEAKDNDGVLHNQSGKLIRM